MKKTLTLLSTIFVLSFINAPAMADDDNDSGECIVGQVFGKSLAEEFGAAVPAITKCLETTNKIKLVMQVNKACRDTGVKEDGKSITGLSLDNHANTCGASRGYGIAQMTSMIKDWKITHGMRTDQLDLNIIVHGGGGTMLLNTEKNKLKAVVETLLTEAGGGVKFHFCMNTVRGMAKNMAIAGGATPGPTPEWNAAWTERKHWIVNNVIPGVTYVTGGLTALSDFQSKGYTYIQP